MESIVESLIKPICVEMNWDLMTQTSQSKLKNEWGIILQLPRKIDFAVKTDKRVYFIEANFFAVGGSKLDKTAREFISFNNTLNKFGHRFIYITDGNGWKKTNVPLRETFDDLDYLLNLDMIFKGLLFEILSNDL